MGAKFVAHFIGRLICFIPKPEFLEGAAFINKADNFPNCLKRFQCIEETHLRQMKEFLSIYVDFLQTNHEEVGQVHADFKHHCLAMTVEDLLQQFVQSKCTGFEKPGK